MDLELTEEQRLLQQSVREFMERECPREYVRQLDEEGRYPYELYDKWVQMGWLGLPFPEKYGGSAGSIIDLMMLAEGLALRGYDIGTCYTTQIYCGLNLLRHGTEEQKDYYLPRLLRGEVRFCISITEPNAGSDAAALTTFAALDGEEFVINGQKVFTSMAPVDKTVMHVAVRTSRELPKHRGISLLLVPNTTPELEMRRLRTVGRRITGTYEIFFHDVRVPRASLLGELNGGWAVLGSHLTTERLLVSARNVGHAQTVVDEALAYAKQREQFGQPIGKFQAIAHMLVDMQTEVDAARLLVWRAASRMQRGRPALKEVCMAKLYSSEVLVRAANNGMQIMGGYGYMMDFDMQRHFRDARISTVTAGTSQIQRNIIAREMGL